MEKPTDELVLMILELRETIKKQKEFFNKIIFVDEENEESISDVKLDEAYNKCKSWIDKIVFVLQIAGRPLRSSEIISMLIKYDSNFGELANPQKVLSTYFTKALKYGRIIGDKQRGQNGYLFRLP
jgi:hypothetical protein